MSAKRRYPSWPSFGKDEIAAARRILKSGRVNYWTGEEGRLFEKEMAEYHGVKYAVAMMNGTVALEAALYALGIGCGDEVIVTPRTFIASASCAVVRGAKPVFAEVDPVSQNITAQTIEKAITSKTKAIIAVHLAGWPCDMDPILELASKRNLFVIEDCAQAHGAKYKGRLVGSMGDVAAFSFCQDKIMTTGGEGGMIVTNNSKVWEKIWSFKDHGKNYNTVYRKKHKPGFRWLHESFGTNWRMTEIQSAIGRLQLGKLEEWIEKRRRNAVILAENMENMPALRVTRPPEDIRHAYYKYYAFVRPEMLAEGWDRDRIMSTLNEKGVQCMTGSCSEIYLEKAFGKQKLRPERRFPVARELGMTSLMFQVHPTLTERDMMVMTDIIRKVMMSASKKSV